MSDPQLIREQILQHKLPRFKKSNKSEKKATLVLHSKNGNSQDKTNKPDVPKWYMNACPYQIYVRSFMDSNGDGIGDLPGVLSKVDYLKYLGIDLIWFNPYFPSTNCDWGYDVIDYYDVAKDYGTLDDFKVLLKTLHQNGIRVLNDLVIDHTSDECEWFLESAKRNPKYEDYYIWADGVDGGPPDDELAYFCGLRWIYNETRGQYYLRFFTVCQPALNYNNPAVIAQMQDVMRFWLDLGVDGFRIDDIDDLYPSEQIIPVIEALRSTLNEYKDRLLICETSNNVETIFPSQGMNTVYYDGFADYFDYLIPSGTRINTNFDFTTFYAGFGAGGKIEYSNAVSAGHTYQNFYQRLGGAGLLTYCTGNHDNGRLNSVFTLSVVAKEKDKEQVGIYANRLYMMMIYMTKMVPFLYYGDEIDMIAPSFYLINGTNPLLPNTTDVTPEQLTNEYIPRDNVLYCANIYGWRDPYRTPMQWNGNFKKYMGFTTGKNGVPWIPLTSYDLEQKNVESQERNKKSTLQFVRKLIKLRKNVKALNGYGEFAEINNLEYPQVYVIKRTYNEERFLILLNAGVSNWITNPFGDNELVSDPVTYEGYFKGRVVLSNYMDRKCEKICDKIHLRQFESVIVCLE